ncbi:MAG: hypothetical protein K9N23_00580 [Akkermansiaceae bacterium]|nr:hypothetical protein [Akkermansiaceae bacterium]
MKTTTVVLAMMAVPLIITWASAAGPAPARRAIPWDVASLSKTPVAHPTKERPAAGMRSFTQINPKKIGLTGISWGGTIVSAVAGIDSRFAFVIPVYGGGFIHQHEMTPDQYRDYLAKWDPSAYLPRAKMPMLWVSGFNEPVFPLNLFSKPAETAGGTATLCIRPFLPHGHGFGWEDVWEIGGFANGVVKGTAPMPRFGRPQVDPKDGRGHAKFTGELKSAAVGFTTAAEWKNQTLSTIPCPLSKDEVIAGSRLPAGTTAYMIIASGSGVWGDASIDSVLVALTP